MILESPVLPVREGTNVTLRCRKKTTSSRLPADFYKDGLLMGSSSTREMTIHNVSKSDEGLYKCRISDIGESPESWLAVRGKTLFKIKIAKIRLKYLIEAGSSVRTAQLFNNFHMILSTNGSLKCRNQPSHFSLCASVMLQQPSETTCYTLLILPCCYSRYTLLSLQLFTERPVPPLITPFMFSSS